MVVRDLRIYADSLNGNVFYYRDKTGYEVDAIIELADGRWGAVEVKMGSNEEDKAVDGYYLLVFLIFVFFVIVIIAVLLASECEDVAYQKDYEDYHYYNEQYNNIG